MQPEPNIEESVSYPIQTVEEHLENSQMHPVSLHAVTMQQLASACRQGTNFWLSNITFNLIKDKSHILKQDEVSTANVVCPLPPAPICAGMFVKFMCSLFMGQL